MIVCQMLARGISTNVLVVGVHIIWVWKWRGCIRVAWISDS